MLLLRIDTALHNPPIHGCVVADALDPVGTNLGSFFSGIGLTEHGIAHSVGSLMWTERKRDD